MDIEMPFNEKQRPATAAATYAPLNSHVRATVCTDEAAFHLHRAPQTLRRWACYEDGPLRPIRVNGRLAWHVADIIRVLETGSAK